MANFLKGMAAQLSLLVIFTHKTDALVFGFLLFSFLIIRWAYLNKALLSEKNDNQRKIILPASSVLSKPVSKPIKLNVGKMSFQLIRE